jgi:hypothetical protein
MYQRTCTIYLTSDLRVTHASSAARFLSMTHVTYEHLK